MHNGYKIIDADAHIHEPHDLWSDFMEPEFYDRRPLVPPREEGKRHSSSKQFLPCELFPEGSVARGTVQGAGQKRQVVRGTDFMGEKYGDAWYAEFTPESRVVDMDRYGWDKQVMIDNFPAAMRLISEGARPGPSSGPVPGPTTTGPTTLLRPTPPSSRSPASSPTSTTSKG